MSEKELTRDEQFSPSQMMIRPSDVMMWRGENPQLWGTFRVTPVLFTMNWGSNVSCRTDWGNFSADYIENCGHSNDEDIVSMVTYTYAIIMPSIIGCGIIGNVTNLIVLTRRRLQGVSYLYLRGKF